MKIKSFPTKKKETTTFSEKEIQLKGDKNLFAVMTVIAQSRNVNMREVFSHPLGQVSTSDGLMRTTNKSALSQTLERLSSTEDT